MGQKTKGDMWCDRCGGPVLAVKSTARLRNSAVALTAVPTGGASLLGASAKPYVCSQCGGPVRRALPQDLALLSQQADWAAIGAADAGRALAFEGPPGERQAYCSLCASPIYRGDATCPANHGLAFGWERLFTAQSGTTPFTRREARDAAASAQPEEAAEDGELRSGPADKAMSRISALRDLEALRRSESITADEFDALKRDLLS